MRDEVVRAKVVFEGEAVSIAAVKGKAPFGTRVMNILAQGVEVEPVAHVGCRNTRVGRDHITDDRGATC